MGSGMDREMMTLVELVGRWELHLLSCTLTPDESGRPFYAHCSVEMVLVV